MTSWIPPPSFWDFQLTCSYVNFVHAIIVALSLCMQQPCYVHQITDAHTPSLALTNFLPFFHDDPWAVGSGVWDKHSIWSWALHSLSFSACWPLVLCINHLLLWNKATLMRVERCSICLQRELCVPGSVAVSLMYFYQSPPTSLSIKVGFYAREEQRCKDAEVPCVTEVKLV